MSEIIKLYENVGIEKKLLCGDRDVLCGHVRPDGKSRLAFGCFGCEYKNDAYPPFTAEKQIELIKKLGNIYIDIDNGCYMSSDILKVEEHSDTFEECLAAFVNSLWQDLTEEEKEQIKEILE